MSDSGQKTENVAAVLKVFGVLEALVENHQSGLSELAQRAMTSKATAHRLLQTMIDMGYVVQDPETEKYGLTLKLFSLGARSLDEQRALMRVADLAMNQLSRATGESINLGILDERDQRVVYIHKYDSHHALAMKSTLGLRNPLHSTSLGKALLAWRPDDEIRQRLARLVLTKIAPRTILDREVFYADLVASRVRGYAEEIEESEAGVRCMAAPIFDHLGRTIAAMSIAFPLFRFDEAKKADTVALLKRVSREASEALGYRPDLSRGAEPSVSTLAR